MKKGDLKKKKGFTIIEVSLVLAIAGLIFLMVFVALPQLQRQQRDARRKDDIMSFLETVKKYQTNNRGALPELSGISTSFGYDGSDMTKHYIDLASSVSWVGFYRDYLGEDFRDPDGNNYGLRVTRCSNTLSASNLENGAECPDNASILTNLYAASFPNSHKIVVILQAECEGQKAIKSSNPRKIAALYKLEGGGVYCANT